MTSGRQEQLPTPGVIACTVLGQRQAADGSTVVTIDTAAPWRIETATGQTRFEVAADQMTEID